MPISVVFIIFLLFALASSATGQVPSPANFRPRSEAVLIARFRALTETLLTNPNMFGFCYTRLYDTDQEVNGLYTYGRRARLTPAVIRRIFQQIPPSRQILTYESEEVMSCC